MIDYHRVGESEFSSFVILLFFTLLCLISMLLYEKVHWWLSMTYCRAVVVSATNFYWGYSLFFPIFHPKNFYSVIIRGQGDIFPQCPFSGYGSGLFHQERRLISQKKFNWEWGAINCSDHELPNFYVYLMLGNLTLVSSKNNFRERYLSHLIQFRKTHRFPSIQYVLLDLSSLQLCLFLLYKILCSAWITFTSADFLFSDTTDVLLFYREHFYGFSEKALQFQQKTRF